MVIGIDIDDTLTTTPKEVVELVDKLAKVDKKDLESILTTHASEINKIRLKENFLEVLNYFKDKGHKLVFITARGSNGYEFLIPYTNEYFMKNNIPFDEIIYADEEKGRSCQKLNVDVFIDDLEVNLDNVKSMGIKTLRMTDEEESKHDIVSNWLEVKDYIDNMWGEDNGR